MATPCAYYNEIDPYAAAWLRNLISEGHIASGEVDERSVVDVRPADLDGFTQCHFFAGIGGWSLALRLAGWPDDRPAWTGSCPCQPFSAAGRGAGMADERHLWPAFYDLIRACCPPIVWGEQVASSAVVGGARKPTNKRPRKPEPPAWLDVVFSDLEAAHYACGAADIPAAGVGAPHIRQRLWWVGVADADGRHPGSEGLQRGRQHGQQPQNGGAGGSSVAVADSLGPRLEGCDVRPLGLEREAAERGGALGGMGDADCEGRHGRERRAVSSSAGGDPRPPSDKGHGHAAADTGAHGHWSELEWLPCQDGKARPTRPGLFPLAHGVRNRVGLLRGAGNAIVPQAGAAWVEAVMGSF